MNALDLVDHRGACSPPASAAGASASSRACSRGRASRSGSSIGVHFVPRVVTAFGGTSADDRVDGRGAVPRARRDARPGARPRHRRRSCTACSPVTARRCRAGTAIAGAAVGALGVLVLVWMVIPSLATAKGWPARMARGSSVVASIDALAPTPAVAVRGVGPRDLRRAVPLGARPARRPARSRARRPRPRSRAAVDARVRASIVKVERPRVPTRSRRAAAGSRRRGLVVTNAHVVAGERRHHRRRRHAAHDYAATRRRVRPGPRPRGAARPAVSTPPPLAARRRAASATSARSTATPAAARCAASPARIGEEIVAVGTDIYRTASSRAARVRARGRARARRLRRRARRHRRAR